MKHKVEFIESYIKIGNDYKWNDNHGELIRCKDCGHWDRGECFIFSMITDDMCFCCWAESKDDIVIIHPEDIVFNSEEDEKAYYEALGTERKEE